MGEITLGIFDDANGPIGVGPLADTMALQIRSTANCVPLSSASVLGTVELQRSELELPRTDLLISDFAPLGIEITQDEVLAFVLPPGSGGRMTQPISRSGLVERAGQLNHRPAALGVSYPATNS